MFSFKALADTVKDFEAALTAPPTPNPSTRSNNRPTVQVSTSTPPLPSSSPKPAVSSPSNATSTSTESPTAAALADSAIANLRASFRKGRASPSPSTTTTPTPVVISRPQSVDVTKEDMKGKLIEKEELVKEEKPIVVIEQETKVDEPKVVEALNIVEPVETKVEELKAPVELIEKTVIEEKNKEEELPIETRETITTEPINSEEAAVEIETEVPLTSAQKKRNKKNNKKKNGSIYTVDATPEESNTRSNTPIQNEVEIDQIESVPIPIPVVAESSIPVVETSIPQVIPVSSTPSLETSTSTITISNPLSTDPLSSSVVDETSIPTSSSSSSTITVSTSLSVEPSPLDDDGPSPPEKSPLSPPLIDSLNLITRNKDPKIAEITAAYKKLQGLKSSLDKIVRELTSLSSVSDLDAFEGELRNLKGKFEMSMIEVGRLSAELSGHKAAAEALILSHQNQATSQNDQISTLNLQLSQKDVAAKLLNSQLSETESKLKSLEESQVNSTEEYEKLKIIAKEEEEKRVKALSLLRALRQKLVKSEKDKEEIEKERDLLKSAESTIQEVIKSDRNRFDQEVTSLRAAQESQLSKMRVAFEKETNSMRLQFEREASTRKGQYELEAITLKASHVKELNLRDSRINQLEGKIREMTISRDGLFDQLQLKTAEVESSSSHQESLISQTTELKYELKEAKDKASALKEEVEELRRARRDVTRDDANTRRLLGETEARHEAKLKELALRAKQLEKDRQETEAEMGSNLQERMREVERMRQEIIQKDIDYAEATRTRVDRDTKIEEAEALKQDLASKLSAAEAMLEHSREETVRLIQMEAAVREELKDRMDRSSELESRLEETQTKESTLRSNNKILRDELRKLQSGVLLSEKQRNPGVGYFASPSYSLAQASSSSSIPASPTMSDQGSSSFRRESVSSELNQMEASGEEALNFEYIRNVILQFLERPEMRTHLVSVLGVILHFTPAEARRLTFGSKQS